MKDYVGGDFVDPQMEAMLQLLDQPVFLVRDCKIFWCNQSAQALVAPGQEIESLLSLDKGLYDQWDRDSVLEMELILMGAPYGIKIRSCEAGDLFFLNRQNGVRIYGGEQIPHTSGKIRRILWELTSAVTTVQEHLDDEDLLRESARINHSVYRLLRLSNKLSCEERFFHEDMKAYFQRTDLGGFIRDFLAEAAPVAEDGGWHLCAEPANTHLYGNIDRELMKQALYYMVSHGLRHSPKGGELLLRCWEEGNWIRFSLMHSVGTVAPEEGPEREDLDFVRAIASLHGGAVVQFSCGEDRKRIVLNIRKLSASFPLKEERLKVDRYGGFHPALVELSDALNSQMYHPDRV